MRLEYGAEVVDRNGKVLGMINYVMRDSWTGEISKFTVGRGAPSSDLFLSPQDVLEETESKVKVNISLDELNENA